MLHRRHLTLSTSAELRGSGAKRNTPSGAAYGQSQEGLSMGSTGNSEQTRQSLLRMRWTLSLMHNFTCDTVDGTDLDAYKDVGLLRIELLFSHFRCSSIIYSIDLIQPNAYKLDSLAKPWRHAGSLCFASFF